VLGLGRAAADLDSGGDASKVQTVPVDPSLAGLVEVTR
jgi:hypothetical protein